MKYLSSLFSLLAFSIVAFVVAPGWAQAGSGFSISGDVEANFSSDVEFEGASNCDRYLNPACEIAGCTNASISSVVPDCGAIRVAERAFWPERR